MSGESAATLCLFAWCQAEREAEFFVEDWGDGAGTDNGASARVGASKRAFRRWDTRLALAVWWATAARATGPGVRVVKNWGSSRNEAALSLEKGVFAPPSPVFKNVQCVRETQILVEQQVRDHAGGVINKFSILQNKFQCPPIVQRT